MRELATKHEDFLVSFLPAETRRITRSGIELHCLQYWAEALAQWIGQGVSVLVYYDPRDISIAYVRLPSGLVVKANVTTPGVQAISLVEWRSRRIGERVVSRAPARREIADASLHRSDQTIALAKASRAMRRRKATKASGDRWVPVPLPASPLRDAIEIDPSPLLSGSISFFDVEDNDHDYQ